MSHPNALNHDAIEPIGDDLFVVHGSVMMAPMVRITRNMTVIRHAGELTLVNAVRLNDEGLKSLAALGSVKRVLRLGPMHGMDDAFYVDHYNAELWGFKDGTTYSTANITHELVANMALPFPNAELHSFNHLKETEGTILLKRTPGVLLTCDAIQSYSTPPHMPHTAWLTRKLLPLIGFPNKTIIGPMWIKLMVLDLEATKAEFRSLLTLDFDQLLSGHGTFVVKNAKQELQQAYKDIFAEAPPE